MKTLIFITFTLLITNNVTSIKQKALNSTIEVTQLTGKLYDYNPFAHGDKRNAVASVIGVDLIKLQQAEHEDIDYTVELFEIEVTALEGEKNLREGKESIVLIAKTKSMVMLKDNDGELKLFEPGLKFTITLDNPSQIFFSKDDRYSNVLLNAPWVMNIDDLPISMKNETDPNLPPTEIPRKMVLVVKPEGISEVSYDFPEHDGTESGQEDRKLMESKAPKKSLFSGMLSDIKKELEDSFDQQMSRFSGLGNISAEKKFGNSVKGVKKKLVM
jgi:hypothetical protein